MTVLDAVVAGGGPAGAAAALRLAAAGREVLLGDAGTAAPSAGEALIGAARPVLRDLGVLDRFLAEGHVACHGNDSAWGSDALGSADTVLDPNGHGWHLDRARFDAFLRAEAAAAGAAVLEGATVREATRSGGTWTVVAGGRPAVRARWLVDATGRRAAVARRCGARRRAGDPTVAVVARYGSPAVDDRDGRTLVEAGPDGWWYTGLVPGRRRVAAYVTDRSLVPAGARTASGFAALAATTRHVAARLDGWAIEGAPRQVAAGGAVAEPPAGDGWVAVGDAAVAFDPLASLGLFTALLTGKLAAEAVDRAIGGDGDSTGAYARRVASLAASYERDRARWYAAERRWADRPFWLSRGRG